MAVINCGECKGLVSTSAKACPHCGAKPKAFKRNPMSAKQKLQVVGVVFVVLVLSNFIPKDKGRSDDYVDYREDKAVALPDFPASPSKDLEQKICKASIATAFTKSPDSISTEFKSGIVELSYRRESDNSLWRYRCNVEHEVVVWAGFIDGDWGRWRNARGDAKITYSIVGSEIEISEQYPGAKASINSYKMAEL
ncbi:hypothetical protein LPB19_12530 [Marinobacter salinisoli]|uniref:Zinc ribbon domain-containing protein n=1 Tax=Marinobacter salinisoli TaxID=2769486 RepID=A0ABX7MP52_9GAMM|nr:hypothetical protein [Marinobacter salinisoli]QSP94014.1 hypothetical protein LPB19_12530 [Marinobacter salinisoli]